MHSLLGYVHERFGDAGIVALLVLGICFVVKLSKGAQLMGVKPPKRVGMWLTIIVVAAFSYGAIRSGQSPMDRARDVIASIGGSL